jgi:hypothetical protein
MDLRIRFMPKRQSDGTWRVYDAIRGSYHHQIPGVGLVAQDHATEDDAQREADRIAPLVPKEKKPKKEYGVLQDDEDDDD